VSEAGPEDPLRRIARRVRTRVVAMLHRARATEIVAALSCVDILVAAYWRVLAIDPHRPGHPLRDRFVLSNAEGTAALYATLAYRGFFSPELLDTYGAPASLLARHPSPGCISGVEEGTGISGHGMPFGIGLALAARLQDRRCRAYVLMGDGACDDGAVWAAAMLAPAHRLERLAAVIECSREPATGAGAHVTPQPSLEERWAAFGWSARTIDGHDLEALTTALAGVPDGSGRPVAIVAHTVKRKFVSFMEGDTERRDRVPTAGDCAAALAELGDT
jgi:transketolase